MTLIGIPVGESTYVVIKRDRIIRTAKVVGADEAYRKLKPKTGEHLFIKVGPR